MLNRSLFRPILTCTLIVSLIGVATSVVEAQDHGRPTQKATKLTRQFNDIYQSFVKEFRATDDAELRAELIEERQDEIEDLLKEHLATKAMLNVLPQMAKVRLLKIDSCFTSTFETNPNIATKALCLYSFAKYCGNNERDEKAIKCLKLVKEYFGELPHGDLTYAKAADNAIYFLENLAVGKKAPLFAGEDTDGVLFRLKDYRGKVVMLRFWGDWCPACRAMYPFERELVKTQKNRPFALIGINSDSIKDCQRAQERDGLVWRTIWDGGSTTGPTSKIFQVKQWPTIIVIDADGVIRLRTQGLAEDQLTQILDRLISEAEEKVVTE